MTDPFTFFRALETGSNNKPNEAETDISGNPKYYMMEKKITTSMSKSVENLVGK